MSTKFFLKHIQGHCYRHFITGKKLCQSRCRSRLPSGTQSFCIWWCWCSRRNCISFKISG